MMSDVFVDRGFDRQKTWVGDRVVRGGLVKDKQVYHINYSFPTLNRPAKVDLWIRQVTSSGDERKSLSLGFVDPLELRLLIGDLCRVYVKFKDVLGKPSNLEWRDWRILLKRQLLKEVEDNVF